MDSNTTEKTLAMAGALQALNNVIAIAHNGRAQREALMPCLQALLNVYQGSVGELYGGVHNLEPGLRLLTTQFAQPTDSELTRYLVTLLYLERRLGKRPAMLAQLGEGLEQARRQAEYFEPGHENVLRNLAGLYSETISTLRPKIMVQGKRDYLEQSSNADQVRAQLLAAIRALSLWRQAGGSRWQLLFGRGRVLRCAEELLITV